MVFSAQQIKFEFLSYIKEFGGKAEEWRVGCSADAPKALFQDNAIDPERDIWLWKPALSPAAAHIVYRYMTEQFRVPPASRDGVGSSIFLFKKMAGVKS
ncbi:hypothetical protein [Hansschlegelia sp. KR7-227]|jgi:hypothetical protein|uniref:hypothetical protein n=1 Tax=Hansschlegelia sp. KR7-227 TaxID=3400914 RepID=UPI003C00D498